MNKFFCVLALLLASIGVGALIMVNAVKGQSSFAESMARTNAETASLAVQAASDQAKVSLVLAETNQELIRAQADEARSNAFLAKIGSAAIGVVSVCAIATVIILWSEVRRGRKSSEVTHGRG